MPNGESLPYGEPLEARGCLLLCQGREGQVPRLFVSPGFGQLVGFAKFQLWR